MRLATVSENAKMNKNAIVATLQLSQIRNTSKHLNDKQNQQEDVDFQNKKQHRDLR